MNDWIYLHGLRLKCRIGVSAEERRARREITADIALRCNLSRAGKSDCLKDTIDYAEIVKTVTAMARRKTFCLLEALAGQIAKICLARPAVSKVTVKVTKTGFAPNVHSAGAEITRQRG
jgi:FolB domain-containing protein